MPLCPSVRSCGCAVLSNSLSITGDGSGANPWQVEIPGVSQTLPFYTFADVAARDGNLPVPQEGQHCWIRDVNEEHFYTGTGWIIWAKGSTAFTPVLGNEGGSPNYAGSQVSASYSISAGLVYYTGRLILGASSNLGAVEFVPTVTLPVIPIANFPIVGVNRRAGEAWLHDRNPDVIYSASCQVLNGVLQILNVGGGVSSTSTFPILGPSRPFPWQPLDEMDWTIVYTSW